MKCPFCVADNPSHANFCMNCGSPQDLRACEECGGINRATAPQCQICGTQFTESATAKPAAAPPPALPPTSHAAEAEALARETQTFKQLFADLEKDAALHLTTPKPSAVVAKVPVPSADVQAALEPNTIITLDPPAYLQQMLSERTAKSNRESRRPQMVLIAIFVIIIFVYGVLTIGARHRPQGPSTSPSAVQPSEPPLSLASVAPILAGVPCSALAASVRDHALQVQGFLPERFGVVRLKDMLSKVPGVKALNTDIQQVDDDKCGVLKQLAPYWTTNRQAGGAASIHTRGTDLNLTEDDPLIVDIKTPGYDSYVNVDYYLVDGNVSHLLPNLAAKDNQAPPNHAATIGSQGDWVISKPFGTELVVLLITPAPLFDGIRPQNEATSDYLRAVEQRLRQLATKYGSEKIAVDLIQITTKARKR